MCTHVLGLWTPWTSSGCARGQVLHKVSLGAMVSVSRKQVKPDEEAVAYNLGNTGVNNLMINVVKIQNMQDVPVKSSG